MPFVSDARHRQRHLNNTEDRKHLLLVFLAPAIVKTKSFLFQEGWRTSEGLRMPRSSRLGMSVR